MVYLFGCTGLYRSEDFKKKKIFRTITSFLCSPFFSDVCKKKTKNQTNTIPLSRTLIFFFLCVQTDPQELCLLFSTYKPSTLFVLIKPDVNPSPPFLPLVGIACSTRRPEDDGWWLAGWIRVCRVFPYIIPVSLSAPNHPHLRRLASPENTSD